MGVFPTMNYPRVVWAGITDGANQLKSIFEQLEPQIHDLGFTPEPNGFSPHLTIARVRSGANKQRLVDLVQRQKTMTSATFAPNVYDSIKVKYRQRVQRTLPSKNIALEGQKYGI